MRFEVKALQAGGAVVQFGVDALDRDAAVAHASARGYRVISLRPTRTWKRWLGSRPAQLPLVLFCQELLSLLQAGLALVEAIETLADKEARPESRQMLGAILLRLREGQPLSYSLEHCGAAFPPLFIASVRASERTGALPEALVRLIEYQQQMDKVRRHLVGAAIYPLILAAVGAMVTVFLMVWVVPRFSQVYADLGGELPLSSRLLMAWGQFLAAHGLLAAAAGTAALALLVVALRAGRTQRWLMRRVWQVPALGSRLRLFYLARFYRSMGMLLRGGMPFGTALRMAADVLQASLRAQLALAAVRVAEGQPISQSMEAHGLTTPIALRMLRVGERSGRMGDMMERIASFYEDDTARWVERFTRLFEPVLMVVIGLLIGCIVVLMYLPIFDLAGNIR